MKKLIFILTAMCFLIISCTVKTEKSTVDLKAEKGKVEAVLEQYVVANMEQDFNLIASIWEEDEAIVMIGTDSDERLVGWNTIERAVKNQFTVFQNTFISVSDQMIRLNETGNTAWFAESLKYNFIYNDEARSFDNIRFTGVLEKLNGKWLLVQGHISIPAEVEMNEVY